MAFTYEWLTLEKHELWVAFAQNLLLRIFTQGSSQFERFIQVLRCSREAHMISSTYTRYVYGTCYMDFKRLKTEGYSNFVNMINVLLKI